MVLKFYIPIFMKQGDFDALNLIILVVFGTLVLTFGFSPLNFFKIKKKI